MSAIDSYTELTRRVSKNLAPLRKHNAEVMQGFGALSQATLAPGALDEKTKELIAMAIGVANRCDACLGFTQGRWCAWGRRRRSSARCWAWRCTWAAVRR